MDVVDQESNSGNGIGVDVFTVLLPLLAELLVELDKEERLVLHVRE